MTSVGRKFFVIIAAPSLILCLAACVFCAWSYHSLDLISYASQPNARRVQSFDSVASMRGLLSYRHERSWPGGASYQIGFAHKTGPADRSTDLLWDVRGHGLHFLGFGYSNSILAPGGGFKVVVPYWFVALLFATVFAGSVVVRRRGRPVGTCSSCGYDLRATPNRCPECGAKPLPAKGAAA